VISTGSNEARKQTYNQVWNYHVSWSAWCHERTVMGIASTVWLSVRTWQFLKKAVSAARRNVRFQVFRPVTFDTKLLLVMAKFIQS